MDAAERQRQIERLAHPNSDDQAEATLSLARSGDPAAAAVVLAMLDDPQRYPREVILEAVTGLIDGAPATLPFVLTRLAHAPGSPAGKRCAEVLGEVAYRQGAGRDPRIVPALVQAVEATLSDGTNAVAAAVAAVRECTRAGPAPEADAAMLAVLAVAEQEADPYLVPIANALSVLSVNHGDALLPELHVQLERLPPDSGVAEAIRQFLTDRTLERSIAS